MKCNKCKTKIKKKINFCPNCGNDIKAQRKRRTVSCVCFSVVVFIVCVVSFFQSDLYRYRKGINYYQQGNYVKAADKVITISKDAQDTVVMANQPYGWLELEKISSTSKKLLDGAKFAIYKGTTVDEPYPDDYWEVQNESGKANEGTDRSRHD